MSGRTSTTVKLNWDPYTFPYVAGTNIVFPQHIKDVFKSQTKEIGGLIMFEKPAEHKAHKVLLANSVFLTAGEIDSVEFTHILTTVHHGSYMIFHTHPLRQHGYNGYSTLDLSIFFRFALMHYKSGKKLHYALSTGRDVHFTFVDQEVLKIIRAIMKKMKPKFLRHFPSSTDRDFQYSFLEFFNVMFNGVTHYLARKYNGTFQDVEAMTELDKCSFLPFPAANYNFIKSLIQTTLNPRVAYIYNHYEPCFRELNIKVEGSVQRAMLQVNSTGVQGSVFLENNLGLFQTTSERYDKFFEDYRPAGSLTGLTCIDSGKIYDETEIWSKTALLRDLDPLSPRTLTSQRMLEDVHGGAFTKVGGAFTRVGGAFTTAGALNSQPRVEMEPPSIGKYRIPKARLTNKNRQNINEYGLKVPSKKPVNYEPNLNKTAVLMNSSGFNYKKNAVVAQKSSWNNYLKQRANSKANSRANVTKRNKNKNKNNTRKVLF
jgi:hypothetical protein